MLYRTPGILKNVIYDSLLNIMKPFYY